MRVCLASDRSRGSCFETFCGGESARYALMHVQVVSDGICSIGAIMYAVRTKTDYRAQPSCALRRVFLRGRSARRWR